MNELPSISSSSYTSSLTGANLFIEHPRELANDVALKRILHAQAGNAQPIIKENFTMRIVKVFIADPNENIPLEKRVIHSGDEKLTDLTDQELFFEVPIAELLRGHNDLRAKTLDKKQSEKFGRDIYLEPVRIKDLKMVVVAIAQF